MAVEEISNSAVADNSPTVSSNCEWGKKLDAMSALQRGWNGYDAEPPSALAIATARNYLGHLSAEQLSPTRVAPSVVGGVGVTCRKADHRVYVEFYNDG